MRHGHATARRESDTKAMRRSECIVARFTRRFHGVSSMRAAA
jgi:hypothetical protein